MRDPRDRKVAEHVHRGELQLAVSLRSTPIEELRGATSVYEVLAS